MLIIGERINSSSQGIRQAIAESDAESIRNEALRQAEAGADYIDVNAGAFTEGEDEYLAWLVGVVQEATGKPVCIDTASPQAAAAALKVHRGKAILNSISGETERYNGMFPLVKEYGCGVVALCLDSSGIPESASGRVSIAVQLIDRLTGEGIAQDAIFIDPLIYPVSVDPTSAVKALDAIKEVRERYPEVHIVCGASNISFGLPSRKQLNQVFLVLAMRAGMDAVIIDPTDKQLMANLITANTLLGKDEYCSNYITAYREGKLGG